MPSISLVTSWSFLRRSRIVISEVSDGFALVPERSGLTGKDDLDDVSAHLVGDGLSQLA
jgi:hypothetical protein